MTQKYGLLGQLLFRVARHRRNPVVRGLAQVSHKFQRCYNNVNYDLHSNGESRLLRQLGSAGVECVFDVGANTGEWSVLAHQMCPSARIHAFEVVPDTFRVLESQTAGAPRIIRNPFGLGQTAGTIDIAHCAEDSGLSSAYAWSHGKPVTTIKGEIRTGDQYCTEREIAHIDFLKVDVEGGELPVLRGFEQMLSRGAIDVIQFEYGYVNILPRFLLADLYEQLDNHGYDTGKVYPTYIDFKPYDVHDEDFQGPNYVAVRRAKPDLRRLLG